MSHENVEVVQAIWRALNRQDVDAPLEVTTDDLEYRPPSHRLDSIGAGLYGVLLEPGPRDCAQRGLRARPR